MTSTQDTAVLGFAVQNHAASLAFLSDLIRAGRDGEDCVQRVVATAAAAAGCVVETIAYRPDDVPMIEEFAASSAIDHGERHAVLARRTGSGGGRSVIFFAHPDGEAFAHPDDEAFGRFTGWTHDPFAGAVVDGRMHGWGVADDLAGVAIMVEALRIVQAAGITLRGDVVLASTPSKRHARGVSALLHRGLTADAAVYLHPAESGAGIGEIKAIASGQVEFRISVEGAPPPSTEPLQTGFAHLAHNAIDKALHLIHALRQLDRERAARVHHPALEAAVGRSTNLMLSQIEAGRRDRLARVPLRCSFSGALSFPPPEKLSGVCTEIEQAIAQACDGDSWLRAHPPRITWVSGVTGAQTPADHALFVTAADAIAAVTGQTPFVNAMHTASDIRNPINQKGIATIGLGPLCGDLSQNGGVDEWVDAQDYLRTIAAVALFIAAWCR